MSQPDKIQETYDYLLEAARAALAKGGSFVPFGAGERTGGERLHLNVDLPWDGSNPAQHIAGLVLALRQAALRAGLLVGGLAYDSAMQLEDGTSVAAIGMHIEAAGGDGVEAFVPYVRTPQGVIELLDPIFSAVGRQIF